MAKIEILLIVLMCVIPLASLLIILPKRFKKKDKEVKSPIKTYEELKEEEKESYVNESKEIDESNKKTIISNNDFSTDDFKSYLNVKNNLSKPKRIELPEDFADKTMPYFARRRSNVVEKPRNIMEEIQNLSPELKALLFTGVFDRKNLDK